MTKHPPVSIFALQTPEERARTERLAEALEECGPNEVKAAYRMLAKKYHPDMVQDELLKTVYAQKFKAVNDAYKHLRA